MAFGSFQKTEEENDQYRIERSPVITGDLKIVRNFLTYTVTAVLEARL